MNKALSPRFILVHSQDATINIGDPSPFVHCFGPFEDLDALMAFEDTRSEDTCYRFALPIVGPEPLDVQIMALGKALGATPALIPLPHREPSLTSISAAQRALIDKAFRKATKAARKEAKRMRKKGGES